MIDCDLEPGPEEPARGAGSSADLFRRMALGLSDDMCVMALSTLANHRHAGLRGPALAAMTGNLDQLSQAERMWAVWLRGAPAPAGALP